MRECLSSRLLGPSKSTSGQRGSSVVPSLVAMGMILVMLTLFTQFAVWQYGRGVLRSAALEAARTEAVFEPTPGACSERFEQVRRDLLGGQMSEGVGEARCEVFEDRVVVTVDAHFEKWLPISPDWNFSVTAIATREVEPE